MKSSCVLEKILSVSYFSSLFNLLVLIKGIVLFILLLELKYLFVYRFRFYFIYRFNYVFKTN